MYKHVRSWYNVNWAPPKTALEIIVEFQCKNQTLMLPVGWSIGNRREMSGLAPFSSPVLLNIFRRSVLSSNQKDCVFLGRLPFCYLPSCKYHIRLLHNISL